MEKARSLCDGTERPARFRFPNVRMPCTLNAKWVMSNAAAAASGQRSASGQSATDDMLTSCLTAFGSEPTERVCMMPRCRKITRFCLRVIAHAQLAKYRTFSYIYIYIYIHIHVPLSNTENGAVLARAKSWRHMYRDEFKIIVGRDCVLLLGTFRPSFFFPNEDERWMIMMLFRLIYLEKIYSSLFRPDSKKINKKKIHMQACISMYYTT